MASAEYLPPLVTKLKGDTSDLMGAFESSIVAAKAWAAEMKAAMTTGMGTAGKESAQAFRKETDKVFSKLGDDIQHEAKRSLTKSGASAAFAWASGFRDSLMEGSVGGLPLAVVIAGAVTAAVFLMPAIGAAIGAALGLGIGAGFMGLGFYLLKDDKTIIKRMHELGSSTAKMFRDAAAPLKGPFLQAISYIQKEFIKLGPMFKHIFSNIAPLIAPLTKGLMGGLEAALPGISDAVSNLGPLFTELGKDMPEIGRAFGQFLSDITENGPALTRFIRDASHGLSVLFTVLGKTIAWLEAVYLSFAHFSDNLRDKWIPSVKATFKGWYDTAVHWLGQALDWIKALPGKIWTWLQSLPGMLGRLADRAWRAFTYAIGYGIGLTIKFVKELPGKAQAELKKFRDTVRDWAARTVVNFVNWIKSLPSKTSSELGKLVDKIKTWASNAPSWLYNAGKDLLKGLVNGITDSVDWAVGKVKEGMHSIAQGARDALGIKSPSTIFAEMGRFSVLGYAEGVNKNAGSAWAAWAGLLSQRKSSRPIIGGPTLSPALVRASGAPSGSVVNATAQGEAVLVLDSKVLARAQIGPVQRANARYNRPIYGGATA